MLSHGRMAYTPAFARSALAPFPGGARLALHPIVNVEVWDFAKPMPRAALPPPPGGGTVPDVPNFAWYQYGQRVGIWRLLETFSRHGARATLSVNSAVCREYPRDRRAHRGRRLGDDAARRRAAHDGDGRR